jgi:hypothetical protein
VRAARRGATFIAVLLECDEAENIRRLIAPGRADRLKLTKTDVLGMLRALLRPDTGIRIDLDVTALSREQAAHALYGHCLQHLPPEH